MVKTLFYLFKEIRPRQWVKNLTVFAAIFFTGQLFSIPLLKLTLLSFISFCFASSAVYILNDLIDKDKDKLHPFKKHRPIASGKLSILTAQIFMLILFVLSLMIALEVSQSFLFIMLLFYLLQICYSFYLKNIILLDILAISAGFILRFFAGEIATGYHLNIWLFLTVISASLFLAIGKRRSELTLLSSWGDITPEKTRKTLLHYSEKMLDVYISMFANSTWITYAFYTFLEKPIVSTRIIDAIFDQTNLYFLEDRKWLMLTIPLVIYGIMRYLQLVYEKNQGESPEKILLSDLPLITTVILWAASVFTFLYVLGI